MLNYLQVVSNFKHRKALSKLRESDHKLNIEVGRHTKLSLSESICTFCNEDIEDEKHFLLKCTVHVHVHEYYRGLCCLSWRGKTFRYASRNSTARLPGGSCVFVDTESAGSRMNHVTIILLVWRVVGHATASGADAGPCIFN